MSFPDSVAADALVRCGRCCCICHKFCGTKIELHHIAPLSDGGADTPENCIPLCFDCHTEVGHYNPRHPRGRRYSSEELRDHRGLWFATVEKRGAWRPDDDIDVSAVEARLFSIGFGREGGREYDTLGGWVRAYVNSSLPLVSMPLHACAAKLRLSTDRRFAEAIHVAAAPATLSDDVDLLRVLSEAGKGSGQVELERPGYVVAAATFVRWRDTARSYRPRAAAMTFKLPIAQLAFAHLDISALLQRDRASESWWWAIG